MEYIMKVTIEVKVDDILKSLRQKIAEEMGLSPPQIQLSIIWNDK